VLVTTDQNLRYQQNLQDRTISIVVLMATSSPRIAKRTAPIAKAIEASTPGSFSQKTDLLRAGTGEDDGSDVGTSRTSVEPPNLVDHGDNILGRRSGLDVVARAGDVAPTRTEGFQTGHNFAAHVIR